MRREHREGQAGGRHAGAGQRRGGDDVGAAVIVVLVIVGGEVELEAVGRVVKELRAGAPVLVAVDPLIGRNVADVAVIIAVEAGEAGGKIIAHR